MITLIILTFIIIFFVEKNINWLYLEIIELNFNGYNFDLRKNIIQIGLSELEKNMITINEHNDDYEENEDLVSN